ncbi:hypothetical protein ACFVIM_04600 [Streptomyces sp. NPDC057638]|uniref:hypothetical protein n=1 Tax=Streptomyces sp. NPDC057638 TaxID=3346190 RepID=UPI0036BD3DB4
MTTSTHEPVMELLRAAIDPASHRTDALSPADLPTGRIIAATAHADADDQGMERVSLMAAGIAMAAVGLTAEIAGRSGQSTDALLDSLAQAARTRGDDEFPLAVEVIRGMFSDGAADGVEILGRTFAHDEADFLTLLLNLAHYCGTSIMALETQFDTPAEQTLSDLESALRSFAEGKDPSD